MDRIQYGYDRVGNRIWRQNTVANSLSQHFDELYGHDAIDRLKSLDRGTLNGNKDAVTSKAFAECWDLDETGNWSKYLEDTDGDGTWNLNQSRTSNAVNELADITESAGPAWTTPAYNAAGNMTTMPQPADPTQCYTATYDAWNRLVKLEEDAGSSGLQTVTEYEYDGAKRRVVQRSYTSGVLSETRHFYYTEPSKWQVIEERLGTSPDSADPDRQFLWGLRYIDDLVLRDRGTNSNGTLDERLYACQDANRNVTALVDTGGTVQERFAYSAYGMPLFLNATFAPQSSSAGAWETLYTGYRYDGVSGMFHVRHRVLHPGLGVWAQRDPLGLATSINIAAYCDSAPIARIDPNGEAWIYILIGTVVILLCVGICHAARCFSSSPPIVGKVKSVCPDACRKWAQEKIKGNPDQITLACFDMCTCVGTAIGPLYTKICFDRLC